MKDLIQRARKGDGEAFVALMEAHKQSLYAIARSYFGSGMDAEDAVAQTVMNAWEKLHTRTTAAQKNLHTANLPANQTSPGHKRSTPRTRTYGPASASPSAKSSVKTKQRLPPLEQVAGEVDAIKRGSNWMQTQFAVTRENAKHFDGSDLWPAKCVT